MEENLVKEYKYKMDKVERYFSIAILVIFFVSFNGSLGFYGFAAFTVIVLAYYFKFYKKRPLYLAINGEEIMLSQGFLFKIKSFSRSDINTVNKLENKIELTLNSGEKASFLKLILSDSDYLDIYEELKK